MARLSRGIALEKDPAARFLPILVAVMVYLAGLGLVAATAMGKLSSRWSQGLEGELTVQIPPLPPAAGESSPAALESLLGEIRATPGVASADIVASEDMARLLEPWLGPSETLVDLPLPHLITVEVDSSAPDDIAALRDRIEALAPAETVVEDHQRWLSDFLGLLRSLEFAAVIVVTLVGASVVALIAFVTRMSLDVHRPVIELLHLMGAHDAYVASQFQRHALRFGLIGGIGGFALTALTLLALELLLGRLEGKLMEDLSTSILQWILLALLPVAAVLIATITARITVMRSLARLP